MDRSLNNLLKPHLASLPRPQQLFWPQLKDTPDHFVLYGGTAIALRLGHRESIDFDFFSNQPFLPSQLLTTIPYLKEAFVIQSAKNTLVCKIDQAGEIQLSFFGGLALNRVNDPEKTNDNHIKVASLLDLAATKVKVILDRASWKDYFDIYTVLKSGINLNQALASAQAVYGTNYNPLLSLKALTYFSEGDITSLEPELLNYLTDTVEKIDIKDLPHLKEKQGIT